MRDICRVIIFLSTGVAAIFGTSMILAQGDDCSQGKTAWGRLAVKSAIIVSRSGDHVPLNRFSRLDLNPEDVHQDQGSAYLLNADKVDAVTTCGDETFVRYHGPNQVSVGWVDSSHLKETGAAHIPLPANTRAVCSAVQVALNSGRFSEAMPTISLKPLDDYATGQLKIDGQYATGGARIVVDGVTLNLVSVTSGGSDGSNQILVWSKDFKRGLSPSDRGARDALNNGDDDWAFGISESLIDVLGQPMVLGKNAHQENFSLSFIDRTGDVVPACDAKLTSASHAIAVKAVDKEVCDAVVDGAMTDIDLESPSINDKLAISKLWMSAKQVGIPSAYVPGIPEYPHDGNYPRLDFIADFGNVTIALVQSGTADLDNTGKMHHVGVVSYEYSSGAGAGSGGYSETPVLFDGNSVVDPTAGQNALLFKQLGRNDDEMPSTRFHARLVTYRGVTYVEYFDAGSKFPRELWKVYAPGAHEMCEFNANRFEVHPVSDRP